MMKKMISMICCAVIWMGMSVICTAAYEFPSEFWEQHDLYEPALENKNYPDIIKYGKTSIEILEKEPNCPETRRAKASKYRDVGEAYFYLQDYQSCEPYYKKLQELVEQYPSELSDFQETVNATVKHLSTDMRLYTDGGDPVYYGARNEKKKGGVLYGACYDGNIRKNLENESMLLSYQELGQQLATYNINALDTAQKRGLAVEIALNCPREGKDIRNFDELSDSLQEMYDLLKKYDDVPAIYLRFGAEFNIWSDLAEPDDFIAAFRQVYRQFTKLDNVAVVWSPYQTSSYGINMHDYYPGDAYVDWVGMSSYAEKYFLGSKKQSPYYNLMFQTGLASTPVTAVSEIIDTYGDRKPIMLSESGCSHYVFPEDEDTTDFAVRRMQEYYEYLPMVYPQIKLMAHFDMYVAGGNNDFWVSNNEKLKEEYLKRTKSSY